MRVVFAGTPEAALPALEAVAKSRHELVAVITRPDAPAGRGRKLVASPVAQRAEELGVPVLKPEHPRDPAFQAELAALAPDCCPVVAYGAMLPRSALDIPRHGWVNLHFSVLPAWRGAAPVQHALLAGDEVTGATTFRIVPALDAGPTFGVMTERVRATDTSGDLLERLAEGGAGLLVSTLDGIEDGTLEAREQPTEGITLAPKIDVADAEVDWGRPARAHRPSGPGLHARAGSLDDVRRGAAQDRPGAPGARAPAPAGGARGGQGRGVRRDGHPRRAARRRQAVREEADGRGRLGPGSAARLRRAARVNDPRARPSAAVRAAPPPTPPGPPPSTCSPRSGSRTPTPTWCCRRCSAPAG